MIYAQLHLTLPAWMHDEVDGSRLYPDAESRIALAIQLSRRNVDHRSGGPFGAAVFTGEGRLVGVGSLIIGDATGTNTHFPGNMFVPIDRLPPILADLITDGRVTGPVKLQSPHSLRRLTARPAGATLP